MGLWAGFVKRIDALALAFGFSAAIAWELLAESSWWEGPLVVVLVSALVRASADVLAWRRRRRRGSASD
jgi:hypothetical protein